MKLPLDQRVAIGTPFIYIPEIATAILRTVEAGWAHAQQFSNVHPCAKEVPITERLRKGMRQALDDEKFAWSNQDIRVLPGTESTSRSELAVPDGLTDIPIIIRCMPGHDPHAIIECKRIAGKKASLCRAYVKEGIDRFRKGKYAGNHSTGFMVGYLTDGDSTGAISRINHHLNRNEEHLKPSEIIKKQWAWQSQHPRTQPTSAIALHHAFLSFCREIIYGRLDVQD